MHNFASTASALVGNVDLKHAKYRYEIIKDDNHFDPERVAFFPIQEIGDKLSVEEHDMLLNVMLELPTVM